MEDWQRKLIEEAARHQPDPAGLAEIGDFAVSQLMRQTSRDKYEMPEDWQVAGQARPAAEIRRALDQRNMLIAMADRARRCRNFGY